MDHNADFLKFISSAQSFWFSLDTSYGHGCHLANRFRLEPNDYKVLLIVAGLALYQIWLCNEVDGLESVLRGSSVLSLCRPLVLSSRRLVVACVASRRAALSLSRLVVASSSLVVLSLHHPLVLSLCSA